VNQYWMCDEGRMTYHDARSERAYAPLEGGLPVSWEHALTSASERLTRLLDADRGSVGVVLSASHTNEDNWVLARLAREFLQLSRVYVAGKAPVPGRADEILRDADVNPNLAGALAVYRGTAGGQTGERVRDAGRLEQDLRSGALKGLIVLGSDTELGDVARQAAAKLEALIVLAAHERGLVPSAHVVLACAEWAEVHGTITNRDRRVQRLRAAFPPGGQALPAWEVVVRLARKLGAAFDYPNAKTIFAEMAAAVPAFGDAPGGAAWGREEPTVQLRFAGSRG
jgi:NADH-quinone oxidoreductase subunit G